MSTIRARVRHGMLEPIDKLDFPEGKEVTITIVDVPAGDDFAAFRRAAGSWKPAATVGNPRRSHAQTVRSVLYRFAFWRRRARIPRSVSVHSLCHTFAGDSRR